jgi:hypothetical protein
MDNLPNWKVTLRFPPVCAGVYTVFGPFACAAVTFALVTAGLALYERQYAAAADSTRDRLQHGA